MPSALQLQTQVALMDGCQGAAGPQCLTCSAWRSMLLTVPAWRCFELGRVPGVPMLTVSDWVPEGAKASVPLARSLEEFPLQHQTHICTFFFGLLRCGAAGWHGAGG